MSLYCHTVGEGPDVVLLHGWGLHSDVWDEVAAALAQDYRVTLIDLPGHGRSRASGGEFTLESVARHLARTQRAPAVWVGWSLGGMIALEVALQHPEQVRALALVASSPQFVQGIGWPYAMAPEILAEFAAGLEQDYRATLERFLAIQAMGSREAHSEIRRLRERLLRHGEPDQAALRSGLRILQTANLRHRLDDIPCPIRFIMGSHDTLCPAKAALQLQKVHPHVETTIIRGAGHSPFISHPDDFVQTLTEFLQSHV